VENTKSEARHSEIKTNIKTLTQQVRLQLQCKFHWVRHGEQVLTAVRSMRKDLRVRKHVHRAL